jgi:hypothetical protein
MAESNLEKSLKKAQTLKVCEFCETNTNIEWKCIDCDLWMCDNCKKKLHIKVKLASKHNVIARKDMGTQSKLKLKNIPCKIHQIQFYCLFCKTCEKCVCPDCVSSIDHTQHDFQSLEEIHAEKTKTLLECNQIVKEELFNVYNTRAKQIDTFRQDQNMQLNEAIQEMRDHAKMIILAVNAAVEQQVELINKKRGVMATYALKEEDKNKRFSLAIQQMAEKIFKSMSYSNTEDLFEAAYNVEKTLQTLEKPSLQLYGQEVVFDKGTIDQSLVDQMVGKFNDATEDISISTIKTFPTTQFKGCVGASFGKDGHAWLLDNDTKYSKETAFHIKIDNDLTTLSTVKQHTNIDACELAVTKSGEVFLFLVKDSAVKRLNSKGELVVYKSFEPLLVRGLHVTKSDEIVVGLREKGALFPVTDDSQRQIVVFDSNGIQRKSYEHDWGTGTRLFSVPYRFASNAHSELYVIDWLSEKRTSRIVALGTYRSINWTYTGKSDAGFKARDIVTTNSGNIVVLTPDDLHILSTSGEVLHIFSSDDLPLRSPSSLDIDSNNHLWIIGSHGTGSDKYTVLNMLSFSGF